MDNIFFNSGKIINITTILLVLYITYSNINSSGYFIF